MKRPFIIGDLVAQSIFYIPTLLLHLGGLFDREMLILSLALQFFLGVYQVLSGMVGAFQGRRWKAWYLLGVLIYFLVWALGYAVLEFMRIGGDFETTIGIGYVIVIPMIIGGFYYIRTFVDLRDANAALSNASNSSRFDTDILDAGMLG